MTCAAVGLQHIKVLLGEDATPRGTRRPNDGDGGRCRTGRGRRCEATAALARLTVDSAAPGSHFLAPLETLFCKSAGRRPVGVSGVPRSAALGSHSLPSKNSSPNTILRFVPWRPGVLLSSILGVVSAAWETRRTIRHQVKVHFFKNQVRAVRRRVLHWWDASGWRHAWHARSA